MSGCRFVASDQPRVLRDRHEHDCSGATAGWHPPLEWAECGGCQPCTRHHCVVCGHRHVDELTCPECVGEARDNLTQIADLDAKMLAEAVHRGVNSEAAHLEAGVAWPDAWRQRRRHGYRNHPDDVIGEDHPAWVLGTWDLLVTEHYGHRRTSRVTVSSARAYLATNLSDLAQDVDFAFDDLARDLRRCRAHLEAVLHDSAQGDRAGIGCFDCGGQLERPLTKTGLDDHWVCRRCRRRYTDPEYHLAVRAAIEREAEEANA